MPVNLDGYRLANEAKNSFTKNNPRWLGEHDASFARLSSRDRFDLE